MDAGNDRIALTSSESPGQEVTGEDSVRRSVQVHKIYNKSDISGPQLRPRHEQVLFFFS